MARARNKLTARQAVALVEPGRRSDGGGLYLGIDGEGGAMRDRRIYLFNWNGKRREMGLGGFPAAPATKPSAWCERGWTRSRSGTRRGARSNCFRRSGHFDLWP
jgi:hypothetical protein